MTTPDLQSLIDAEARRITAFNESEHSWQDCPEGETAHRKGRYCEHQVRALARHLVANKHPVQQDRIEDARLTDEELATLSIPLHLHDRNLCWDCDRTIADAATAKALTFQDARRKALVEALREIAADDADLYGCTHPIIALAALKGLDSPPTVLWRNEAGVLDEYRKEGP